jgi:hypothetical protein
MQMNIQDTGIRGYLKWLQQDQPQLYLAAAPIIAQQLPEVFSDREQSAAMGGLMGMSDAISDAVSGVTTLFDTSDTYNPSASGTAGADVASAENSGTASPSITNIIGNIVSALSQGYLAKTQVDTLNQVNQIQLQRAQMGLAPLNTGSLSLGIPQVNLGLSSGTLAGGGIALAAVVGLGLLFLFTSRAKRSARR